MTYKRTQKTIEQIGRELGADDLLEGSMRRRGRCLRIAVQLIDVSDQTHLWAEAYEGAVDKILDLQVDVARTTAEEAV